MSEKDTRKKKVSARMFVVLLLIAVVILAGAVTAKYVHTSSGSGLFTAKEFYFTSNLLTEKGDKYTLSADAGKISFTLGNNADQLRYAADDIAYTYTVKENNKDGDVIESGEGQGTLTGGTVSIVNIEITGVSIGKTYYVEAVGKAGYEKTLKATFVIAGEETLYKHWQVDLSGSYGILTVWSKNVSGTLNVSTAKTNLIPDSTDMILSEITNFNSEENRYDGFSFTDNTNFAQAYSSKTYRFFLDQGGPANLTVEDFTVKIDDDYVAAPATP